MACADPLDLPPRHIEEAVGEELDRRRIVDEEPALSLQRSDVPAEVLRDRPDLRRCLLQREEDPRLPPARALEEEVQAHERLARPGAALDHGRARPRQATEQERVEAGDPGGDPIREVDRRLAVQLRSPHARVEREPVGAHLEEVAPGNVVRAAHFQDFELPGRRQLLALRGETHDAVGNGELRGDADVLGPVLADQQRRCPPRRDADREVVDKRPGVRGAGQEVVDGLEAVDGHDVRFLAFDALYHPRQRLLDAAATEGRAEIGEDDTLLDQAGVEEREELHVADDLQRRLGERGEVEALFPLPGVVEQRLEREDGFSGARLAGNDRHRPGGKPPAKNRVQRGGSRAQPLES